MHLAGGSGDSMIRLWSNSTRKTSWGRRRGGRQKNNHNSCRTNKGGSLVARTCTKHELPRLWSTKVQYSLRNFDTNTDWQRRWTVSRRWDHSSSARCLQELRIHDDFQRTSDGYIEGRARKKRGDRNQLGENQWWIVPPLVPSRLNSVGQARLLRSPNRCGK